MTILVLAIFLMISISLTIVEFMLLRGVCKFLARALVNGFGSNVDEKEKARLCALVSIFIFSVMVLLTWKLLILLIVGNMLLPVAILKVLL